MSLIDRFSSMRARGTGGGGGGSGNEYDISKIGTPVSCIAQSAISLGDKIEGVKNVNYTPKLLKEALLVNIKDVSKTSQNLETIVNIDSSRLLNIYIKNSQNSYTVAQFNLDENYTSIARNRNK